MQGALFTSDVSKCSEAVLHPRRAATFTAYDLRHLRLTKLAEAGNILGAAYLAGHKRPSTTDRYLRPSLRAGEHALRAVGPTGFNSAVANPVTRPNRLAGVANPADHQTSCEGEDLNLHGSYPASTSIEFASKFPRNLAESPKPETAATGRSVDLSGDRPPIVLMPALEALTLAAERVLGRRFVEVSSITRRHRKGVA
jgi:hypothetical protein